MIRIFIADDHPIVRQGLRRIVESDPGMTIAGEASDADGLLAELDRAVTDLVLLDVSMPGGPFLETLQRLRAKHPTVRVLVLFTRSAVLRATRRPVRWRGRSLQQVRHP